MKLKEKYHRLLVAREQWKTYLKPIDIERIKSITSTVCTNKLINTLLNKYTDWELVEQSHCCYGWKECCWEDLFAEGVWEMSADEVVNVLKNVLKGIRKNSKTLPVFYIYEIENKIYLLVTNRHLKGSNCTDWIITGEKKDSVNAYERH